MIGQPIKASEREICTAGHGPISGGRIPLKSIHWMCSRLSSRKHEHVSIGYTVVAYGLALLQQLSLMCNLAHRERGSSSGSKLRLDLRLLRPKFTPPRHDTRQTLRANSEAISALFVALAYSLKQTFDSKLVALRKRLQNKVCNVCKPNEQPTLIRKQITAQLFYACVRVYDPLSV